MPVEERRKLRQ